MKDNDADETQWSYMISQVDTGRCVMCIEGKCKQCAASIIELPQLVQHLHRPDQDLWGQSTRQIQLVTYCPCTPENLDLLHNSARSMNCLKSIKQMSENLWHPNWYSRFVTNAKRGKSALHKLRSTAQSPSVGSYCEVVGPSWTFTCYNKSQLFLQDGHCWLQVVCVTLLDRRSLKCMTI